MFEIAVLLLIWWGFYLHDKDKRRQYEHEKIMPVRIKEHTRRLEREVGIDN